MYKYLGYYPIEEEPVEYILEEFEDAFVDRSAIVPKYYFDSDSPNDLKWLKTEFKSTYTSAW